MGQREDAKVGKLLEQEQILVPDRRACQNYLVNAARLINANRATQVAKIFGDRRLPFVNRLRWTRRWARIKNKQCPDQR